MRHTDATTFRGTSTYSLRQNKSNRSVGVIILYRGNRPMGKCYSKSSPSELSPVVPRQPDVRQAEELATTHVSATERNTFTSSQHLKSVAKEGNVVLVDGEWLVKMWKDGKKVPCRNEAPPEAFFNWMTRCGTREVREDEVQVVSISYPWLTKEHPDPCGFHLSVIAEVLEMFMNLSVKNELVELT